MSLRKSHSWNRYSAELQESMSSWRNFLFWRFISCSVCVCILLWKSWSWIECKQKQLLKNQIPTRFCQDSDQIKAELSPESIQIQVTFRPESDQIKTSHDRSRLKLRWIQTRFRLEPILCRHQSHSPQLCSGLVQTSPDLPALFPHLQECQISSPSRCLQWL